MKSIRQTCNGPLGNFKCLGMVQIGPWVILWTRGTSEVGTFCSLVNASLPILTHECYHFCQWTNGLMNVQELGMGILVPPAGLSRSLS